VSVDRTRQLMEKGGCIAFVMIVVAIVMAASMFTGTCARNTQAPGGQNSQEQGPIVARIGKTPLPLSMVEKSMSDRVRALGAQATSMTPAGEFSLLAQEMDMLVGFVTAQEFARSQGITLTDESIREWTANQFEPLMQNQRKIWVDEGKLKPDHTEEEYKALAVKESQIPNTKTYEDIRKGYMEAADRNMKDPVFRLSQYSFTGREMIKERLAKTVDVSEPALLKRFDDLLYVRLYFGSTDRENTLKRAQETLAKIRSGANFEQLVDEMSQDSPDQGKKKSETLTRIPRSTIDADDSYAPLRNLKPGEISDVVDTMAGPAIYKLVRSEAKLPPDFKTRRTYWLRTQRETILNDAYQTKEDEFKKNLTITWESPAFQFAYDYSKLLQDPAFGRAPAAEQRSQIQALYEKSKTLASEEELSPKVAVFARYAVLDSLWSRSSEAEKTALREDRITSIQDALQFTEQPALRMELVTLLAQKNDPEAATQLLLAAQTNNAMNPIGDFVNERIAAAQKQLTTSKLLNPEQVKEIEEQVKRFKSEKEQLAKAQAQAQAQAQTGQKDGVTVTPMDPNDPEFKGIREKMEREMREKQKAKGGEAPSQPVPQERTGGR